MGALKARPTEYLSYLSYLSYPTYPTYKHRQAVASLSKVLCPRCRWLNALAPTIPVPA